MWQISQLYGLKLTVLYKKNPIFLEREIRGGDVIYLQKKKKKN